MTATSGQLGPGGTQADRESGNQVLLGYLSALCSLLFKPRQHGYPAASVAARACPNIDILGSPVYVVLTLDAKEALSTDHKEV